MTTWYVRPGATGGSNNGTSYENAWEGWSAIVWGGAGVVAGDTLYVCGNHLQATVTSMGVHGGTSSLPVTIRGDYAGDAGTFTFSSVGYLWLTRAWTTVRNLTIITPLTAYNAITITADGTRIANNTITGGKDGVSMAGSAILTVFEVTDNIISGQTTYGVGYSMSTASSTSTGIKITGNTIHDVGLYGAFVAVSGAAGTTSYVNDVKIRNNTIYNCAGYSIYFDGTTADPLTGPDPTIYSSGLEITGNTIYDCGTVAGAAGKPGGIGVNGTVAAFIYKNSLTDCYVTGGGIQSAQNSYPLIYRNTITGMRSGTPTSAYQNGLPIDGNGIFLDNRTRNGRVIGNYISDLVTTGNTGSGAALAFWDSSGGQFIGNVVENVACGLMYGHTSETGNLAYHNTFINCTVGVQKVNSNTLTGNITVKNNILKNCTTGYSLGSIPCITHDYNCVYGSTTAYSGTTAGANDLSDDPDLDVNYRPQAAALKRAGTYLGGKDYNGKDFYNPPNIGAVEDHPTPAWAAVAA